MARTTVKLGTFGRLCRGIVLVSVGLALCAGCSDTPPAPPQLKCDPAAFAKAAIAQYDGNGDGILDAKELEKAPALKAMLATVNALKPGHGDVLSADDIAGRVEAWLKGSTTLMGGAVSVLMDGQPLADAAVTFDPEAGLGPSYRAHSGTTNANGRAELDAALANYPGIYVGLYRVKISKKVDGKETIPECYNEKTVLGREVAGDVPNPRTLFQFDLTSKQPPR
jgi:hypothetical protein